MEMLDILKNELKEGIPETHRETDSERKHKSKNS